MAYALLTALLYAATVAGAPIATPENLDSRSAAIPPTGTGSFPGFPSGGFGGSSGTGSIPGFPSGGSGAGSIPGLPSGGSGAGSIPGIPSGGGLGGSGGSTPTNPFPGFPSGGFGGSGGSTGTTPFPGFPSGGTGSTGSGGFGGGLGGTGGVGVGGASSTANDASGPCLPITVLYARGTSEPGNIGSSVGPSLESDLKTLLPGKVAFQGVNYTADTEGDTELGKPGGQIATSEANQILATCPDTKLFVSGYSEGAMVAHDCVASLSTANKAKVVGVLVFGDPFDNQTISGYPESNVKTFCAQGDAVCQGEFSISAAHLSYAGADTQAGAQWIQQKAGL